jgi:Skp family chaperone for outer membrane proteins
MDKTLSLIPADGGTGDFPVLKAFQEYIDAEQAKARKRMLGLSVFFVVLLIVVVITFVMILTMVVNRNQALSDRLLDYALRERETATVQVPVAVPTTQQSVQDSLKPLIEKFEREREEMKAALEKQRLEAEARVAASEAKRKAELEAAKEQLERERRLTKKENERQEEILRHRRRLYPEYYNAAVDRAIVPVERVAVSPPPSPPPSSRSSPAPQKPAPSLSEIKPLTYFNIDDEDEVPFIIETLEKNK